MSTTTARFCGNCGESTTPKDRFCTSCGSKLRHSIDVRNDLGLTPPSQVEDDVANIAEYYGGMVWVDKKGSFVVPDFPSPKPMNFMEAVKHCFRNFGNFRGRASRSEYWYFVLLYPITSLVMILAFALAGFFDPESADSEAIGLLGLLPLATLVATIPALAAGVRRLHDTGRSAKWLLINLIPFGGIVILFFLCEAGDEVPNRFGPP